MTERRPVVLRLVAILVSLATCAVFLPALQNQFVSWDDDENFLWNPHYRGLGLAELRWMFTSAHLGPYSPLSWITLGFDYRVWGLDPWGYHLTSLILHCVNAFLVYLIALRLLDADASGALGPRAEVQASRPAAPPVLAAGVAALLFSIHPLRVESVAWVTERRDIVVGLFTLLTVLAYLEAHRRGPAGRLAPRWYWAAVALFGLALLSKAVVVGLALVLFALDVYPLRRFSLERDGRWASVIRYGAVEKAPFIVLGVALSAVSLLAAGDLGLMTSLETLGPAQRLALTGYGLTFYVWKTLVPSSLSPLYTLVHPVEPLSTRYLAPAAVAAAITVAVLLWRRRWPAGLLAWITYVTLLFPAAGILHNGPQLAADRYSYMACLPFALLGGASLVWLRRAARDHRVSPGMAHATSAAAVVVVVSLAALTVKQVGVWRDSVTLWRQAAQVDRESDIPIFKLGWALIDQGRLDEARVHFADSLARVPPELPGLRAQMKIQLGIVEQRAGHLADAERALGEGLALDPGHPAGLIRLGVVRLARGNESAGREDLSRAIALMGPDSRYKNWELRQAIEEIPDTARSERGRLALGLGLRLQASGALEQAEEQYLAASTLLSDSFDAWNNLGVTYALRGRYADALGAFTRALSIAPGHPKACANAQRATAALGVQPHEALARCRG